MKFIEVPIKVAYTSDLNTKEDMGIETSMDDYDIDSIATINVDAIDYMFPNDNMQTTTIYFRGGQDMIAHITYTEILELINGK